MGTPRSPSHNLARRTRFVPRSIFHMAATGLGPAILIACGGEFQGQNGTALAIGGFGNGGQGQGGSSAGGAGGTHSTGGAQGLGGGIIVLAIGGFGGVAAGGFGGGIAL